MRGVGIREEQVELSLPELAPDAGRLLLNLPLQLLVARRELGELDEIAGSPLEARPELELLAERGDLLRQLRRPLRLVPDARLG